MEKVLNDFKLYSKVPSKLIDKYNNLVPKEIIIFWKEYGFGTFMQGYLKSVNPEDYIDILKECSQRYKNSPVLFVTSMGDLVLWADGYVRLLYLRSGVLKTVMPNFLHFFNSLESETFRDEYLNWIPYPAAVKKWGAPPYDECFGYTPLLGLGGANKAENLKKVKLKEHIRIIALTVGPV
ncbi:T6SS immunity protein Tdi1 domain-containing protein [Metabacillus indicus]|uniref:DUF1851 domain-containing protein n=1 Tax=Metabacillus indicus TaxID=246786 RepID=A0A084H244_METID|nr:T6SS immunity protein Tdi1 domain-containing protein [Metabacillus indicus]KEZ53656.1 hypothetical protein GS18_0201350 [Metabacillus indicus]